MKKKKARTSPLSKEITKYRLVNSSSSYIPSIYTLTTISTNRKNLIIAAEQQNETSGDWPLFK